jgi:hypothetical protein
MATRLESILFKVNGIVESLEQLPKPKLAEECSPEYGDNYNTARRLVLEELPELADFAPPAVTANGGAVRYVEILSHANELRKHVRNAAIERRH